MTLYVESRVVAGLVKVIPINEGTCPDAMLIAEPVMKADMAGSEMKSTSHPSLRSPRPQS